jgi:DNA-binding MarR family transcriptional regulator
MIMSNIRYADPMTEEPTRSSEHISRGLVRLMMGVGDAYAQASREVGLTAQQAQLLCAAQRPAPIGEIAAFLRCDPSNVSHLVDRADRRGLLQRSRAETDGRVKLVELSPDGEQVVRRFIEILGSRFNALLTDWPEQRREEAHAILHALAEALERGRDAEANTLAPPTPDPFP